ncbi:hypothetical protein D7V86_00415 [bacterium D16-51]|nr:hypothetical protein D7V96_05180 [bacterium D16-59]RKI62702.1 hypothetical protein D7V86_00415 [bacterium D16-51]
MARGKGGKSMNKKSLKILVSVLLVFSLVFQMSSGSQAKAAVKLNMTKVTLTLNNTVDLYLENTSSKPKWSSSKKSVATVDSSGEVTAKGPGTAKITAKVGKKQYVCKINVPKQYLSSKTVTLNAGESKNLRMYGVSKTDDIFWCSDNEDIATISSSGKITAVRNGKTTVYAILNAGLGETYSCDVIVQGGQEATPSPVPPASASPSPSPSVSPSPTPTPNLNPEDYYNGNRIVQKTKAGFYHTDIVDVGKYFSSDIETYVIKNESSNRGIAYVDKVVNNRLVMVRTGGYIGTAYITLTCNTERVVLRYNVEHKQIDITGIYVDTPGITVKAGDKIKIHIDTMMDNAFKSATFYLKSYELNVPARVSVTDFVKDPKMPYSYVAELTISKDMPAGMWGLDWCMVYDDKGYVEMVNANGTVNEFADTFFFFVR